MRPKCYKSDAIHYGREHWQEFVWIDPFVCSGCGVDFRVLYTSEKLCEKMCGSRYGNIVLVGHVCGCEFQRVSLVLLDDDDFIVATHTVNEDELRAQLPEVADWYFDDRDWGWDDDDYDPIMDESDFWPEWYRKYQSLREAVQS